MHIDTNASNIRLVVPSISILLLITFVVLSRIGWYGRVRTVIDRHLWNEQQKAWLLMALLLFSAFSFGVLAGYVLIQAWW
jgi:hypothetical protein